jgi:hypothetical protein
MYYLCAGPGYEPLLKILANRSAKFLNSGRRRAPGPGTGATSGADSDDSGEDPEVPEDRGAVGPLYAP